MILSFGLEGNSAWGTPLALVVPSVLAIVAYGLAAWPGEAGAAWRPRALLLGGAAQAVAIVADIAGLGTGTVGAHFGFAPALSITLWLVMAVYVLETQLVPLPGARRKLAVVGVVVVGLALAFPGQLHPQVVSQWAPVHWLLGIASYGLFGVAVLHGVLVSRAERQLRRTPTRGDVNADGMPLLRLERLTFRFIAAGFVTLTAAIVLGAWPGGAWRWDHKTVFSVLGWFVFAGLLVGRSTFGLRGAPAMRWLYLGALLLLLAYVGTRFVFEVMLHRAPAM